MPEILGEKAYKAAVKQTLDKLKDLREIILESSRKHICTDKCLHIKMGKKFTLH